MCQNVPADPADTVGNESIGEEGLQYVQRDNFSQQIYAIMHSEILKINQITMTGVLNKHYFQSYVIEMVRKQEIPLFNTRI